MVYVMWIPKKFKGFENELCKSAFFGNYGNVQSVSLTENPQGDQTFISAFVTYDCEVSATLAVIALDKMKINDCLIRAGYGRTKYCINFLNKVPCLKKFCTYTHKMASPNLSFFNHE